MVETAHVAPWKKQEVEDLKKLITENPVVAIANVEGIPAAQMQQMRKQLRADATLRVVKNTLLTRALEKAGADKEAVDDLIDSVEGQTALITTDMNPFTLYKRLEAAKTKAPAKGGETAPEDVAVEKGDTPFAPGPVVGDLQKAGIPAAIEGGKVVIKQDKVLVEAGETIPREVAQMLTRLDIHPLTVGIHLRTAYEDGTLFDRSVLDVDEEAFLNDLKTGAARAFNLAVNTSWFTELTAQPILAQAHQKAINLGVNAEVTEPGIVDRLLSRAQGQVLSLASHLDEDALDEELQERLGGASATAEPAPSEGEGKEAGEAEADADEDDDDDEEAEEGAALGAMFG